MEQKGLNIKIVLKIVLFIIIFTIIFTGINKVLVRKSAYTKSADFFNQKEAFDVLFFGSSHMINAVYPMEIWKESGIVSYNLANHAERIAISYYNMLLALKTKNKPKLVVIDTYMANYWDKIDYESNGEANLHNTLDSYQISLLKAMAIKDIFGYKANINRFVEYLFPFSLYHSRWNQLTENDFNIKYDSLKGAEPLIAVKEASKMSDFDLIDVYSDIETPNMLYLRKMIEYCKENGIEILVVELPYPAVDIEIAKSKYYQKICDEYGVNYINFIKENIVNYNIDFYDGTSHLNVSGARKVSRYLSKYIANNYNISDKRNDPKYANWNKDYEKYVEFKLEKLAQNEKYLANYLMLLHGEEDIAFDITISSKKELTDTFKIFIKNLDNKYKISDDVFKGQNDKTVLISLYDIKTKQKIKDVWF